MGFIHVYWFENVKLIKRNISFGLCVTISIEISLIYYKYKILNIFLLQILSQNC